MHWCDRNKQFLTRNKRTKLLATMIKFFGIESDGEFHGNRQLKIYEFGLT